METVRDAGGVPRRAGPRGRRPTSRWWRSRSAGPAAAGGWWPRTPARWPARTARTRRSSTPTACCGSTTWTSCATPSSCSPPAAAPAPADGRRPCTTPAPSARSRSTWPTRSGCRSRAVCSRTRWRRLGALLDPGLEPANPLDVWGTGQDTRDAVRATRCRRWPPTPAWPRWRSGVDLVQRVRRRDGLPGRGARRGGRDRQARRACSSNAHSSVHQPSAQRLRAGGVPVLEGTRSGMLALRHLLRAARRAVAARRCRAARSTRRARPGGGPARRRHAQLGRRARAAGRLRRPGRRAPSSRPTADEAVAAAEAVGLPGGAEDRRAGGARTSPTRAASCSGLTDAERVRAAYEDVAARLGPRVAVSATAAGRRRDRARPRPRPAARAAGARRRRRGAGRAAARPRARRPAGGPRARAARWSTGCGCGRCSTACAALPAADVDCARRRGGRAVDAGRRARRRAARRST